MPNHFLSRPFRGRGCLRPYSFVIFAAAATLAHGSSFLASTTICVEAPTIICTVGPGNSGGLFSTGDGPSSTTTWHFTQMDGLQFSASSSATAGYGVFHSEDSLLLNPGDGAPDDGYATRAQGTSNDTWTITGGTGSGLLLLSWTVSGNFALSNSTGATPSTEFFTNTQLSNGATGSATTGEVTTSGVYNNSFALPFTFGTPFGIQFFTFLALGLDYPTDPAMRTPGGVADLEAEFADTVALTGVTITDGTGTPIPNAQISTASGTVYPLVESNVPEPGTLFLSAVALAALFAHIYVKKAYER